MNLSRKRKRCELWTKNSKRIKKEERNWDEWVSATSTRNFLLNDPILDWLNSYSHTVVSKYPDVKKMVCNQDNFNQYIMNQGIIFEKKITEFMKTKFGKNFREVCCQNARSEEKVKETIDLINSGVPIIYGGLLHNEENKTYGIPDLIVRNDWVDRLLNEKSTKQKKYTHYEIVDIKYSTLYLNSSGNNILNTGSFPAYKGQLWIYNKALAKIQNYEPEKAYILGRKWIYTSKGLVYKGNNCFDKLGVIDFKNFDSEVSEKTKKAIEWIREVRINGHKWNVDKVPFEKPELYPNMSNIHDYPWRPIKKRIADNIHEITSLWMCGVKNRNIAHSKGIYGWNDKKCTSLTLGVKGDKTAPILDRILKINKGRSKIYPLEIKTNTLDWKNKKSIEFYVDFEYITDVMSDINIPVSTSISIICIIGLGYFDSNDKWMYKSFVINNISELEEKRICNEFSKYVEEVSQKYNVDVPLLIHWSGAEDRQWKIASGRHGLVQPLWFDMYRLFKNEPIVVKGALTFSLKDIARAFYDHGYIKTIWPEKGFSDGLSAMYNIYKISKEFNNMEKSPRIKDIVKYNEIDCRVMGEIIQYLRKNCMGDR